MELVCPAGSLPALKAAIDNGADAVYTGFRDDTNARHFAGLNFSDADFESAVRYVRERGRKIYIAINTYARPQYMQRWQRAVDCAADLGVDAIIAADIGVLAYASKFHPRLRRHLSVQASATNPAALAFYHQEFGVERAVLPRVLSAKQVAQVVRESPVPIEVFGFGSLCIMVEGRCQLSSYVTGQSPNTCGVCSPAKYVQWQPKGERLEARLNGVLIDTYEKSERTGYPTLCKGRFEVEGRVEHALEEPVSLNTLALLPELQCAGVAAIKIEGRQRSPAYSAQVARVWREAFDALARSTEARPFVVQERWQRDLAQVSEGAQTTLGAYDRDWQ